MTSKSSTDKKKTKNQQTKLSWICKNNWFAYELRQWLDLQEMSTLKNEMKIKTRNWTQQSGESIELWKG